MSKRPDDALFSVSDIGVDSILDAAGLGEVHDSSLDTGGQAPLTEFGSDLGFGRDAKYAEKPPNILDEAAFAQALGQDRPLVPEDGVDDAELSGIDSDFFHAARPNDAWEVPANRGNVGASSNPNLRAKFGCHTAETAPVSDDGRSLPRTPPGPATETVFRADPRVSQLPHFELELPQDTVDPAEYTVIEAEDATTGVSDARAGIVKKRRSQRPNPDESNHEGSSTQRPVLIRPNDTKSERRKRPQKMETPKNGGQVLARAKVVSKVVRRRRGAVVEPSPIDQAAMTIPADEEATIYTSPKSEAVRGYPATTGGVDTTLEYPSDEDGAPDEIRVERPTGAAALVAWMNDAE